MKTAETIELSGNITFKDLLRFQYFHIFRRSWWFFGGTLAFLALLSLVGIVFWFLPDGEEVARASRPFVGLLVMWIAVITACPYMTARKQVKTMVALQKPIEYTFSPQGIHIVTDYSSGETSWQAFWSIAEAKTFFAVYFSISTAFIIPKRFFADTTQQETWRELVEAHIQPKKIVEPGVVGKLV